MKLDFITTGLGVGGAERALVRLVKEQRQRGHEARVISLTANGPIADQLKQAGIETLVLGITPGTILPGLVKLTRCLGQGNASLIQTWMYHANVLGTLANRFAGNVPVIWGIRQSNLHPKYSKRSTRMVAALGGLTSKRAHSIVCCAESVREIHEELGYDAQKMVVIPNGVDVDEFKPMEEARRQLRNELQINDADAKLIGVIGRFDPQKDHQTFLRAAKIFDDTVNNTNIILCGDGMDRSNKTLATWIQSHYDDRAVHLLGVRTDIAEVIAGLDLLVSSASYGEGFPNVVAEAMACQIPVVGTDVGETTKIVGDYGLIVEPENPRALADAMLDVFSMDAGERCLICEKARSHIKHTYSLERMGSSYEKLYTQTMEGRQ